MIGRAVVVGGGFAALEVALALRSQRPAIPVTVISTETEVIYRPWLIRVPAGGAPPPVIPFARLLAAAGVDLVEGTARSVDVEARLVVLDSGIRIDYGQLVVATGAVADRGRISGAREHALFPCDLADATEFAKRIASPNIHVVVIFGWERPGPGLEYAAWIAARRPGVQVTAIDGDGTMARRFGGRATAHVRRLFERRGAQLITEGAVERIGEGAVEVGGRVVVADVIAIAAPLRGTTDWLPPALVDERGMLRVDSAMASTTGVFGIGDVVSVPEGYRLPPALRSIQATAGGVARNVIDALGGDAPKPVLRRGRPDMTLPDLAGTAVLVRERRLLLSGLVPLFLRSSAERRYLRSRSVPTAT
ncbi:MAG: FAD-dependent oxidoreductase [Candidatus Dormibacteraeota bacterium]|nr:FAD-dependent oxidoreductase [Candidatus Dormibacteraeota bacterium]